MKKEKNENIEEKLYKLAYIDKVTNIENNNYFLEKGTELLKQQFEGHLLIIDVGKFKIFNKKYGRVVGDNLLKNIGKKLKEILGEKRIITRLANDIFAVILEEKEQKELTKIIEKLLKELSNIEMEKNKYKILISIGVSKIEKEDKDIFEILDKAIIARDEAKKNFNKKYHIFNQELENQIIKEHDIELIIEEGIQNQEFKVFYQPKVNAKNENLDDLFQVGCIGLVKAIDNFDLSHEVKFSTYAVPMILGEIKRYLRDNNSIRVSRSTRDLAYKALKLKEEYFMENGKEISVEKLAEALDVTVYDVVYALESLKDPLSMFEPIYNDGGDTIYVYDQIEDKKKTGSVMEEKLATNDAVSSLNERERLILNERYIIGKTQMEIAEDMNISQAQVSRLEKNAIKQLKKTLR